ncbi:MAG TPA: DUF2306 domain-containing protein [Bryobacteraceae bacterium]|nr:DUF2306 domain-containing protein [Bryobacteraceae bacterium]
MGWSGGGLVAASWASAGCFGLYILAFYLGALPAGHLEQWNENLPGLYTRGNLAALAAMAAHLGAGAIILLLGPIQLIAAVRRRWPALHRWLGRVYVFTAALAGFGGLGFIASSGTIGGAPMDVGFGLYGALMVIGAAETYRHARARRFDKHRRWAVRLFALAIGSWLYRMDYGFWLLAAHGLGHTHKFRGPFDIVMAFFFYVPNLALAEWYLRAREIPGHPALRISAAMALNVATLVVLVGTYYFVRYYWGPGIVNGLLGRAS